MPRRIVRSVAAALAPALLAAGAGAQSWETQDEIAFAKNLARFRLFDLATEYIEKLEKSELPQDERLACLYAHAFIEKVGGDYDTTTEGRLGLLKAAIGHYGEFLSRIGPEHKNADDARGEAAACQRRLGSLLAGLAAQGVDPAANRAAAETAFRDAVKQLNALFNERKKRYEAMEDADPNDPDFDPDERTTKDEAKIDAYDTVYELSATYYEWSQLYPENDVNRHDYLKKCLDQSNEYLWEMGAETVRAYEVTFYAGLAHLGLNNVEDGLASLEYIVDDSEAGSGIPKVIDRYPDLPPGFVADLTRMVEKTFLELARIRNRRSEYPDTDKLAARMEEFYKKYASRGAKRSETGEQFLLEVGMARFRSGNAAGMKLLEEVAQRNPANDVGQRAGELIAEVVRASASAGNGAVKLPPSTWITTAKAARNQNRLLDAIDGWHHAIGALPQISDQKERAKTAAECWYDIGNGYRTLGRNVEAALAFREGLAVASAGKDVEEDVVQQIGISWYQTLVARFKETKDPQDRKTKDEALRKLAIDYNVKDTRYLVAKDEFEQARAIPTERKEDKAKAFAECAAKLGDVKQDDSQYDRARILLARCEGEQGELDRKHFETALRTLDAFDKHAREHEPPPEKARLQHREISRVESVYYRSEYLLALEQHDKLLEVLKNFEKDFPGRREFLPEVRYRQLRALIALGRLPEAEAHYAAVTQQIESGELASWRDTASFYLSRAFLAQADQEADAGKRNELLRKGADLMVTYCRDTQYTSFPNLHLAAETYARIGTWPKAEETYRKLVEVFGKEAQYREQIDQRVKRQLAQVLMEQRKFKEAEPIFRELEIRFPKDPTLLRTAALCYGGWVDIEDKKAVEVPGSGEYKRAIELWELLVDKGFPRETEKQNPGWYEAKFHTIFCRWRAKESDPSYLPQAQKLLQNFEANVWPFIQDEAEFLTWIGGENWKRRWDYLRERLR